ncbi:MAG: hypothetical protein M3304_01075, partial [Actinomycetota bacterium]|nr:hypothetical protein [Actinomycetota bacterium]
LKENKQPLTDAQMTALLHWAREFRACAKSHDVALARPKRGVDEVTMTSADGADVTASQFRQAFPCTAEVGEPPQFAAFSLARDRHFHVYAPRACLLPVTEKDS